MEEDPENKLVMFKIYLADDKYSEQQSVGYILCLLINYFNIKNINTDLSFIINQY